MTRTVAVLGLGGIGGMLVARTGALGVGTERAVEAVRERGLRLVHGGETIRARPEATTRLEAPVSLLVIAVKSYDLPAALDRVAPEALGGAVILPLLNGLEHVEMIRARVGEPPLTAVHAPHSVAAASIGRVSVSSPEPGVVVQTTHTGAAIRAASRHMEPEDLADRLAPLAVPGIEVAVGGSEGDVLWEKAARLAVLASATVATRRSIGPLRSDPAWRPRLEAALAEACAVASADGVALDADAEWAIIEAMPDDLTTSAARDAASGGPTELDAIAGSVVRAGVRLGVPTPALRRLVEEAACRAR